MSRHFDALGLFFEQRDPDPPRRPVRPMRDFSAGLNLSGPGRLSAPLHRPIAGPIAPDASSWVEDPLKALDELEEGIVSGGTVGPATQPEVVSQIAQEQDRAIVERQEQHEAKNPLRRGAIAVGRGINSALGEIPTKIIESDLGIPKGTISGHLDEVQTSTPEKVAYGAGVLGGAGLGVGATNAALVGIGSKLPQGSRAARALGMFGDDARLTAGQLRARDAVEGVGIDLLAPAESGGERAANVGLGAVGGALLGAPIRRGFEALGRGAARATDNEAGALDVSGAQYFYHPDGSQTIITPSARAPGRVQATVVRGGAPVGHNTYDSIEEAVGEMNARGFRLDQPPKEYVDLPAHQQVRYDEIMDELSDLDDVRRNGDEWRPEWEAREQELLAEAERLVSREGAPLAGATDPDLEAQRRHPDDPESAQLFRVGALEAERRSAGDRGPQGATGIDSEPAFREGWAWWEGLRGGGADAAPEANPLLGEQGPVITQEAQSYGRHGWGVRVPAELEREFTEEIHRAYYEEDGSHVVDRIVSQRIGQPIQRRQVRARGWWEGDESENTSFEFAPDTSEEAIRLEAAYHGIIEGQDGVAWYQRVPDGSEGAQRGWVVTPEPGGGSLTPEQIDGLRAIINADDRFAVLRGAHVRDGQILFRNFTDLPDEQYASLLGDAMNLAEEAGVIHNGIVNTGSFRGDLYNGPRAFYSAIGRDPDGIRQARDVLVEKVGPVYARWAERVGGPDAAARVNAEVQRRAEGLNALIRELENPPLRGNTTGGVTVAEAALRLHDEFGSRYRPLPARMSARGRVSSMVDRLEEQVADFVEEAHIPPEMARDWYPGAAGSHRKIVGLIQPEIAPPPSTAGMIAEASGEAAERVSKDAELQAKIDRLATENPDYVLRTFASSVMSNGQQVAKEIEMDARVGEQFQRTGKFSLIADRPGGQHVVTPVRSAKGQLRRQKGMRGEATGGFEGEEGFWATKTISQEEGLQTLNALITQLGKEGAARHLLSTRTVGRGKRARVAFNAIEDIGPKVGQYALDKLGIPSGGSTIDLWMARMYNFLTGKRPPIIKVGRDTKTKLRKEVKAEARANAEAEGLSAAEVKEAEKEALDALNERLKDVKVGDTLVDDSVSPQMRREMQEVLAEYANRTGSTPSSAQAMAWYVIKNLYRRMGAQEKADAYATLGSAAADFVTSPPRARPPGGRIQEQGIPDPTKTRIAGPETPGWYRSSRLERAVKQNRWEVPTDEAGIPAYAAAPAALAASAVQGEREGGGFNVEAELEQIIEEARRPRKRVEPVDEESLLWMLGRMPKTGGRQ